jgi:uncharacterized protein YjhX (UPF0386 family)
MKEPACYTGESSLTDYLKQFKLIAELNQWDKRTKALELATSLRDKALTILGELSDEGMRDYDVLVSTLRRRFEPPGYAELYRVQLKSRQRTRGEPLVELASDIKRLVRQAYPADPKPMTEMIARDAFMDALDDMEMEWRIFQTKPHSIDEALQAAIEFESFRQGRQHRQPDPGTVRMNTGRVSKGPKESAGKKHASKDAGRRAARLTCFFCKQIGHKKADCVHYQKYKAKKASRSSPGKKCRQEVGKKVEKKKPVEGRQHRKGVANEPEQPAVEEDVKLVRKDPEQGRQLWIAWKKRTRKKWLNGKHLGNSVHQV